MGLVAVFVSNLQFGKNNCRKDYSHPVTIPGASTYLGHCSGLIIFHDVYTKNNIRILLGNIWNRMVNNICPKDYRPYADATLNSPVPPRQQSCRAA